MADERNTNTPDQDQAQPAPNIAVLIVGAIAAATLALNLYMGARVPLWFDEGHTYLMARDGLGPMLARLWQDVHPPLFFALESLVINTLGMESWHLRLVPALAAAAIVPAMYCTARLFASVQWSVVAAALAATHPMLFYYGHEARSYSLVVLLVTLNLYSLLRILSEESRQLDWFLLLATLIALLQTHNLGLFLFPCYLTGVALTAGWKRAARVAAFELVAFALYLPWFWRALSGNAGVAWIADYYWHGMTVWVAPLQSILALGVGAEYASHLRHLGMYRSLPLAGGGITVILLAASLLAAKRERLPGFTDSTAGSAVQRAVILLWSCSAALLLMWGYSRLRQPIYLVGRYDILCLPVVSLLMTCGLNSLTTCRLVAWPIVSLALTLNCWGMAQMVVTPLLKTHVQEELAAEYVRRYGSRDDVVVCFGLTLPLTVYFLDVRASNVHLMTFPSEVMSHPGWYNANIFLRKPWRLVDDARLTVTTIEGALQNGQMVWVVGPGEESIDVFLRHAMSGRIQVEPDNIWPAIGLARFTLDTKGKSEADGHKALDQSIGKGDDMPRPLD